MSVVAFDPFTTTYGDLEASDDCTGGETSGNCSNRHLLNDCQSSGVFSCDSMTTSGTSANQNHVSSGNSGKAVKVNHVNNNASPSPPSSTNVNNCATNLNNVNRLSRHSRTSDSMRLSVSEPHAARIPACYRLGSIGQDTQLCLWDLTEDVLKHPFGKSRPASRVPLSDTSPCIVHSNSKSCNSHHHQNLNLSNTNMPNSTNSIVNNCTAVCNSVSHPSDREDVDIITGNAVNGSGGGTQATNTTSSTSSSGNGASSHNSSSGHGILSIRFGALGFGDKNKDKEHGKEHRRNFSLGSSSKSDKNSSSGGKAGGFAGSAANFLASLGISVNLDDPMKLIGTQGNVIHI